MIGTALLLQPPLDPDQDQARDWLIEELSRSEYQQAKPNLLDRVIQAIVDWFASLFSGAGGAAIDLTGLALVVVLVAAAVIVAVLVGRPALRARSRIPAAGAVFFEDDRRSAAELRQAAERAAARRDWAEAIREHYRAIVRELADRTLLALSPGATAQELARRAASVIPAETEGLHRAAADFDAVRYLGRSGSEEAWLRIRELDARLRAAAPAQLPSLEEVQG